ncbi:MAG TPA: hypothetical protein VG604_00025 [Candidatus Saccharimonadales bacterium]|nr:hypothetical protein [Candidatus Saccharimonadales bacterium]
MRIESGRFILDDPNENDAANQPPQEVLLADADLLYDALRREHVITSAYEEKYSREKAVSPESVSAEAEATNWKRRGYLHSMIGQVLEVLPETDRKAVDARYDPKSGLAKIYEMDDFRPKSSVFRGLTQRRRRIH